MVPAIRTSFRQDHFVNADGGYLNPATSLHAAITNATNDFFNTHPDPDADTLDGETRDEL